MSRAKNDMTILMADDDPDDYCLVKDALMENGLHNEFRHVSDGEHLMDCLSRPPFLVLFCSILTCRGKTGEKR